MKTKILLLLCSLCFVNNCLWAQEIISNNKSSATSGVYSEVLADDAALETQAYPFHQFVTLGVIRAYQKFLSPAKGTSCPMHPHCSLYGSLSFKTYHPVRAFFMTSDRLYRCGHDVNMYQPVLHNGAIKFFDPPSPSFPGPSLNSVSATKKYDFVFSHNKEKTTSFSLSTSSSENSENEETRLFRFAEMLQVEGDYNRAITEYRRLLFYFPHSSYQKHALKAIFHCYYGLENYPEAIQWGQNVLNNDIMNPADQAEFKFFTGASYFKLGDFPAARERLGEVSTSGSDDGFKEKSLLLQGLSYAKETDWENAERAFASLSPDSMFAENAKQCKELSQKGRNLPMKNPTMAGILAISPGMGYLYSGYKQTALSAFIINALFIGGTIEAFRKDHEVLGTTLGLFGAGWYAGNIYGSVVSARRRNTQIQNDFLLQFNIGFSF